MSSSWTTACNFTRNTLTAWNCTCATTRIFGQLHVRCVDTAWRLRGHCVNTVCNVRVVQALCTCVMLQSLWPVLYCTSIDYRPCYIFSLLLMWNLLLYLSQLVWFSLFRQRNSRHVHYVHKGHLYLFQIPLKMLHFAIKINITRGTYCWYISTILLGPCKERDNICYTNRQFFENKNFCWSLVIQGMP